jgi:hypothetical protein
MFDVMINSVQLVAHTAECAVQDSLGSQAHELTEHETMDSQARSSGKKR